MLETGVEYSQFGHQCYISALPYICEFLHCCLSKNVPVMMSQVAQRIFAVFLAGVIFNGYFIVFRF